MVNMRKAQLAACKESRDLTEWLDYAAKSAAAFSANLSIIKDAKADVLGEALYSKPSSAVLGLTSQQLDTLVDAVDTMHEIEIQLLDLRKRMIPIAKKLNPAGKK
jgi:hypothetical protein